MIKTAIIIMDENIFSDIVSELLCRIGNYKESLQRKSRSLNLISSVYLQSNAYRSWISYRIRPKFAISVKYPSYGSLFGRIFTAVPCRLTIATFLLVHCLHLGHILYAESVSLTKFYLLFLRNDI